ncbi:MAG TPA: hypothetical protein VKU01_09105 [Bryobacteraceae bacterium]|nr:hypothetical protein [Bryobacteraceae bacterium]
MQHTVLEGSGHKFEQKPERDWRAAVRRATSNMRQRLSFMTPDHHAVRNFAVRTLPTVQRPVPVDEIAGALRLPRSRVQDIVEELERHLFFLVRNPAGEVAWAFPVTADATPHEIECSRGYLTFGACAEDAFAASFVLGHLLRRPLKVDIRSVCGESGNPLQLTVGSDRSWRVKTKGAQPLLFVPSINWEGFHEPNIINNY